MGKKSFNKLRRLEKKRVETEKKKEEKKMQSNMYGLRIDNEV